MPEIPNHSSEGDEPPRRVRDPKLNSMLEEAFKESDERHRRRMAELPAKREAAHRAGKEPFNAVTVHNLSGCGIDTARAREELELQYYNDDEIRTLREFAAIKAHNI